MLGYLARDAGVLEELHIVKFIQRQNNTAAELMGLA
jgi:hypothetical protein